jgi:hypothetical protein
MKYRKNKVKREHGISEEALLWLEQLSSLVEVTDIIPGVINVNHSPERGIVYKYETNTGCKLLLKSNGTIQEVFVVTKNPTVVQAWVNKEFPIPIEAAKSDSQTTTKRTESAKKKSSGTSVNKSQRCNVTSEKRVAKNKQRLKINSFKPANIPESKIADRLDHDTLKTLSHLKNSLQKIKKSRKYSS